MSFLSRPSALLAVAAACVAALALLSDFEPQDVAGLRDLDGEGRVSVMVLECRECEGGYLLGISDGMGGEATAFCPGEFLSAPLAAGEAVTLTLQPSEDDPNFLFVRSLSATTVKD